MQSPLCGTMLRTRRSFSANSLLRLMCTPVSRWACQFSSASSGIRVSSSSLYVPDPHHRQWDHRRTGTALTLNPETYLGYHTVSRLRHLILVCSAPPPPKLN